MLNIFNLKLNNSNFFVTKKEKIDNKSNDRGQTRHYPPANREWFNSIYAYNKNTSKLLHVADKAILILIKSYFNLYSADLEKTKKTRRTRRFRRLSVNRILISRAELKHTSDKVIITIYIYNRHLKYYLNKIKTIATLNILKKKLSKQKLQIIVNNGLKITSNVLKQKKILFETLNIGNNKFNNYGNNYVNKYLKIFIFKCLHEEMLYLNLKQIIFVNKSKFNCNYLLPLSSLIAKIYKKKIEFNIVNLKYLYLNSYIFTETLVTKIKNRKNRVLRVLKASLSMFKLPPLNKLAIFDDMYNRKKKAQNLKVNHVLSNPNFMLFNKGLRLQQQGKGLGKGKGKGKGINSISNNSDYDTLDLILSKVYSKNLLQNKLVNIDITKKKEHVTNTVLCSIKHKSVSGIRIEAAGRLTRRNTAERSAYKLRYKGNIRNEDSSFKGLSTVILRGHAKSNLQYTKLKSKKKIGSFGLKGWISSN
uniref:Small ribosomal subunit protein uS3m n=1 Tax=Peltigera malacea TaxID=52884 RepID=G5CEQ7_9LECA|nr:ribosomal protein subunit 3 [Peltigera malacea]AEK48294.1 ribosomal protein subunit 3 [Peltigera malacea]